MSFQPLRALISLIAALASLFVIYGTLGTALMVFKIQALDLLTRITLSASWLGIATISANNIDYWFSSIWVIGVALIVYTFLSAISSTVYERGQGY
jgi:hypothetical protein